MRPTLSYFIVRQLPMPRPSDFTARERDWLAGLAATLLTSDKRLSAALGTPAVTSWNPQERGLQRAWLDAFAFWKLGYDAIDAGFVLETFTALHRAELAEHGEYLTKRRILDALAARPWT